MGEDHKVTVEQRCYAAQALWVAVNRMLDDGDPRAKEWLDCIGFNQMRYKCRCKHIVEAFFDAYEMTPPDWLPIPEDFADMFLRVCVTRKSMNVNRDWKIYLQKEIDRMGLDEPTEK